MRQIKKTVKISSSGHKSSMKHPVFFLNLFFPNMAVNNKDTLITSGSLTCFFNFQTALIMLFASNNVSFQTEGITVLKIIGHKFFPYFEKLLLIESVPQIVPVQGCLGN